MKNVIMFYVMIRRPPISTRTDTLFPYTTLFRSLRASHIKPWAKCASGDERVDGNNGLLLSPTADHLFDRGWITFDDDGALVRSAQLPGEVISRIGVDLDQGRKCGSFSATQKTYLEDRKSVV